MIGQFAGWLGTCTPWQRLVLAFAAGALTIVAYPPVSAFPLLWVTFPFLLWLLDGCETPAGAAATGGAFGFGYFLVSFHWIANAFYVDADTFGAFAWPAVAALSAGFALYIAIVCGVTHLFPPPGRDDLPYERFAVYVPRVLFFASAWTVIEWVRGWLFTGFAWNPISTVWSEEMTPVGLPMIQVTALIGTYGLTLFTVLAAAAPAILGTPFRERRTWVVALAPTALLVVFAGGGALRLAGARDATVDGVKLRLVQANISQADRARPDLWPDQIREYLRLSQDGLPAGSTAVIWGEAAVPPLFSLNASEQGRRLLSPAAPDGGLLITGADRGIRDANGDVQIYNSLFALTDKSEIEATYDKTHLVPFGEYMPLRWLIPFKKLTEGVGDFSKGAGVTTLHVSGLPPFTPLICYEAIFSGAVTPWTGPSPRWLLNLTNDAWFGMSWGPYQHYAAARLRAVEEGLPLVRVANTGISAVIDGYGRTRDVLGLGEKGVLDAALPLPAADFTLFGTLRNILPLLIATFGGAAALFLRRRYGR
ncbi:MAG: apolipoprotein N-acyltransferase [Rhodospirillaceae bacterium]|nr:apolipoprotein N-acyltransferase [Rhodospirillaceae bacterium]